MHGVSSGAALAALAIVLVAAVQAGPAPLTSVPGTALLLQFDEGSGTVAADSSGNGNDGMLLGAAQFEAGLHGSAVRFPNDSGYSTPATMVEVPAITVGSDWTIQGWTQFPVGDGWDTWVTFAQNGPNFHHVLAHDDGQLGVYNGMFYASGYNISSLSGWHLLSAVGSGGQTTFYIDDTQVGVSAAQVTSTVIYIGNHRQGGGQTWGLIDSFRILTVARSAGEIAGDFNTPGPSPSPSPGPTATAEEDSDSGKDDGGVCAAAAEVRSLGLIGAVLLVLLVARRAR